MIYVISIGAFQALIASLLLWTKRSSDKADSLLIMLMICIATHLGIKFYIYAALSDVHVRTQMNTFIGMCYGPLVYLYYLKRKNPAFIPATQWYHFIPVVVAAIGYLSVACLLVAHPPTGYKALNFYNNISTWIFVASGLTYPLLVLKGRLSLPKGAERRLITHIGFLMMVSGLISLGFLLYTTFTIHGFVNNIPCRYMVYTLLSIICIDILRYKYTGISAAIPVASQVVAAPVTELVITDLPEPTIVSNKKMQLPADEHERLWQKLELHLQQSAIYQDAELTLEKLADAIHESKYHVSETLNAYAHKTFYQYINEYRIHKAVELMDHIKQKGLPVNILTVAYESGFKAKSSFNAYFKKILGETPSAYLLRTKSSSHQQLMNA
ncbi:AraC family transcriptional regulator [Chitinophaga sp. Cy-1792]|uniref:helix-turn-helix domain-containing protein n=1 Tax=Chitinophaga sp. Cy-1792 TaxID=2608339 RepID=UPI0014206C97|nr:helix-turn-helix domain-containing protein [Chitinophaga sp. Cy-1792]NIG56841.1 helix-turn-helix transcriptional regulator [Chitinophaga sp. Cy-1792]